MQAWRPRGNVLDVLYFKSRLIIWIIRIHYEIPFLFLNVWLFFLYFSMFLFFHNTFSRFLHSQNPCFNFCVLVPTCIPGKSIVFWLCVHFFCVGKAPTLLFARPWWRPFYSNVWLRIHKYCTSFCQYHDMLSLGSQQHNC